MSSPEHGWRSNEQTHSMPSFGTGSRALHFLWGPSVFCLWQLLVSGHPPEQEDNPPPPTTLWCPWQAPQFLWSCWPARFSSCAAVLTCHGFRLGSATRQGRALVFSISPRSPDLRVLSICIDRFYTTASPLSFKVSRKPRKMIAAPGSSRGDLVTPVLSSHGSSWDNHCTIFLLWEEAPIPSGFRVL